MKIGILGIGGVGGFVGARLCDFYENDGNVKIIFICRGETKNQISQQGLVFESNSQQKMVHPALASDDVDEIGVLDILLIATKSYSLRNVLETYSEVIGDETIVIPLQNMVNAKEVIRQTNGDKGIVMEGCIYVSSHIVSPGHIHHVGGPGKIIAGGQNLHRFMWAVETLAKGGVDIEFVENIAQALWQKYLFIAPAGAITTAYDVTLGGLAARPELMDNLKNMMGEMAMLAREYNVELDKHAIQSAMDVLNKFPANTKTSLQVDFENNRQTEKEYLVDYIIDNCQKYGIDSNSYSKVNARILARTKSKS